MNLDTPIALGVPVIIGWWITAGVRFLLLEIRRHDEEIHRLVTESQRLVTESQRLVRERREVLARVGPVPRSERTVALDEAWGELHEIEDLFEIPEIPQPPEIPGIL